MENLLKIDVRVLKLLLFVEGVSVDISITNLEGEFLCTLSRFEMTRHSNSIHQPVKQRYQLEWQPVAIPSASSKNQSYVRELSDNTRDLWMVLDYLAAQTIAKTLRGQFVVGVEVNCSSIYICFRMSFMSCGFFNL